MLKDFIEGKAEQLVEKTKKTPLEKLTMALLGFVSVSVIVLGFLQIKTTIEKPFLADRLIEDKAKIRGPRDFLAFFEQEQKNRDEVIRLQSRDSDGDGLTDYQEIYIYRTNAYSPDSDGDGIADAQEVEQGTDPNCPEGEVCDGDGFIVRENIQTRVVQEVNIPTLISQQQDSFRELLEYSEDDRVLMKEYFASLTPEDLKELLRLQGYSQEQLDALKGEDLQKTLDSLISSL